MRSRRKAGGSSRSPNKIFPKVNCTKGILRVKENLSNKSVSDDPIFQEWAQTAAVSCGRANAYCGDGRE